MRFNVMQLGAMAGAKGDIFWDMPPWMTYAPGYDLGCSVYVANNTEAEKEYALMARLTQGTTILSEEALPVFGYTWFKVDPGDFIELEGALRFSDTNAVLTVELIERETGEAVDSVATVLIAPSTSALPPVWPGTTTATGADTWSSMLNMVSPMIMLAMLGMVMVSAFKPQEKKAISPGRSE